jgi:two-component system invasion response regulator UvrY
MADIVVADEYPVVRIGLRQVFAVTRDFRVIADVGDSAALLQTLERAQCELLVLDPALPDLPVFEVIARVRRQSPRPRVLVFGVNPEQEFAVPVIAMGASGYLHKRSQPERILLAVRTVLGGDTYLGPVAARRLVAGDAGGESAAPHNTLSRREMGVLLMLGAGRPLKRIAAELNLSPKTVSTYRSRLLQKLGMASNADLTRYVLERGLI